MNGFERVHECVGGYTDAGQYDVHPNEPIVRCKECRYVYEHHDARGRWLLCGLQLYDEVKPEDFCSRGETEEDYSDGTD